MRASVSGPALVLVLMDARRVSWCYAGAGPQARMYAWKKAGRRSRAESALSVCACVSLIRVCGCLRVIEGAEVGSGIAVVSALRMGRGGTRACWARAEVRRRRRKVGSMDRRAT